MTYTAFAGPRRLASGSPAQIAGAVRAAGEVAPVLIFDDETGAQIDLDLRGTPDEVAARYRPPAPEERRPGRPRLGVVSREISLLPRHWDWLGTQPGGASAALRRLVEGALRERAGEDRARRSRDAAHRFMYQMAGDLPGFEEASRALYAGDFARLDDLIAEWPGDVRDHVRMLLVVAAQEAPG